MPVQGTRSWTLAIGLHGLAYIEGERADGSYLKMQLTDDEMRALDALWEGPDRPDLVTPLIHSLLDSDLASIGTRVLELRSPA